MTAIVYDLHPRPFSSIFTSAVHYRGDDDSALTTEPAHDWDEHRQRYGARPTLGAELIERLADARLTGRGGAHVPAAAKWLAVRKAA